LLDECAPPVVAAGLLDHMVRTEELHEDGSGLRLGRDWLEAAACGEIHANIEGTFGATVEDARTGAKIATGVLYRSGKAVQIGGDLLRVRRWTERKIEVDRLGGKGMPTGEWSYSSRAWARGPGQPQAVRRYLDLDEQTWPMLTVGGWACAFHFGGARRRAVLGLLADEQDSVRVTDWYIRLPATQGAVKPPWVANPRPAVLALQLYERLDTLERQLARPAANRRLPVEARLEEIREWLDLDAEIAAMRAARWEPVLEPAVASALQALAGCLEESEEDP